MSREIEPEEAAERLPGQTIRSVEFRPENQYVVIETAEGLRIYADFPAVYDVNA